MRNARIAAALAALSLALWPTAAANARGTPQQKELASTGCTYLAIEYNDRTLRVLNAIVVVNTSCAGDEVVEVRRAKSDGSKAIHVNALPTVDGAVDHEYSLPPWWFMRCKEKGCRRGGADPDEVDFPPGVEGVIEVLP